MEVFIAISSNTMEHMEALGSNSFYKESLSFRDGVYRNVLHTDKNYNRMDGREVGNEMSKDVRHAVS